MCRLIETIRFVDRKPHNLEYHQKRLAYAQQQLFSCTPPLNLAEILPVSECMDGLVKCRVVYRSELEEVSFEPYTPRRIESLKIVEDDTLEYSYKYLDRSKLNRLFEQRGNCDEVLIVRRGLITDTTYTNVVLFDGVRWITPASPLLKGVQRQFLLDSGRITEKDITASDIKHYTKVCLVNAMMDLENAPSVAVENIVW